MKHHQFHLKKQLSFIAVLFPLLSFAQANKLAAKQAISIETGYYSLTADGGSASGLGMVSLEYIRALNMKWAVSAAYSQFLSEPSNLSSNVYGFDILGHWCPGTCRAYTKENDPTNAKYFSKWNYSLQFGFSQRFLQIDSALIGANGLRIGGEIERMTNSPWSWFGRLFMARMVNGDANLSLMGLTVGARWWF